MTSDRIHATYLIETPRSIERAAEVLAGEQSTGTFVEIPGETKELKERFRTRVEHIERLESSDRPAFSQPPDIHGESYQRAKVTVSIPMEMAGSDLTTVMASVAGNIYELKEVSGLRLVDLALPRSLIEQCPRPRFGVDGTRELAGVYGRPLIGSVVKPAVGLSPEQIGDFARVLIEAGVDFIKDDEMLTNPPYCPLEKRVEAVMRVIHNHADKTGKRVMFAFNISGEIDTMMRQHDLVAAAGGNCVQVNLNQVGLAGVSYLRRNGQLAIQGHRGGWGIYARQPFFGMDFRVYARLWRLTGVDQLVMTGLDSKFWEPNESVIESISACLTPILSERDRALPALGSAQWGGQARDTYTQAESADLLYIAGAAIVGHSGGAAAGVRAIKQAWDAAMQGIPLDVYAREHPELRQSIEQFGKQPSKRDHTN